MAEDVNAFCQAQWPGLVRTLTAMTGDMQRAQDLAQEAIARVILRWPRVRGMEHPGGYLFRIGMNLARDDLRARRDEPAHPVVADGVVDDHARRVALVLTLRQGLARLTPRQRTAVTLRHLGGLSVEESASAMGCRPGTVTALCHQAMRRLRADHDVMDLVGDER